MITNTSTPSAASAALSLDTDDVTGKVVDALPADLTSIQAKAIFAQVTGDVTATDNAKTKTPAAGPAVGAAMLGSGLTSAYTNYAQKSETGRLPSALLRAAIDASEAGRADTDTAKV